MKILHILPSLSAGGAETVTIDLVNYMDELGHEVEVLVAYPVAMRIKQQHIEDEVKLIYLLDKPSSKKDSYLSLFTTFKHSERFTKYDVIHCHLTFGFSAGCILKLTQFSRRFPKTKIVFTDHSIGGKNRIWQKILSRLAPRIFDSVILVGTNSFWNRYLEEVKNPNVFFVPNGIFIPSNETPRVNSKNSNQIVVGTISRLVPERAPIKFLKLLLCVIKLN